jgi:hypothetical protein
MRNNFFKVLGLVGLALFMACTAHADGTPVNMVFTGVNGAQDGQFYVSPYFGTMNGQAVTLFCDDVLHEVTFGQSWSANVTNLGTAISTSSFSNTRFGSGISAANATILYEEVAWLVSQFTPADQSQWVSIQHALWDLTDPGAGYTDVGSWLTNSELASNYSTVNPSDFLIVTNVGLNAVGATQVQEFIVRTPEPSSLALLVSGMLALMLLVIRRGRA